MRAVESHLVRNQMKQNWTVTLLAAGLLSLGSSAIVAQDSSAGSADRMNNGSPDQSFMMKAAQGGMAEVELGNVAQSNGQNDDVKKFGQRMVNDHSKAGDELKNLASQKNVTLPTSLDAMDQATKDRLSGMNGAAFDHAYMTDMVKDHKTDIALFEREARHGQDPDVKAWAAKTLPTLRDHLKQAEKTDSEVK